MQNELQTACNLIAGTTINIRVLNRFIFNSFDFSATPDKLFFEFAYVSLTEPAY